MPVALVAGIVLQRLWPGDFEYGLRHGGPGARDVDRRSSAARSRSSSFLALRRPPLARAPHARPRRRCAFVLPVSCTASRTGAPTRSPTAGALTTARPQPAHEGAEGRGRDRAARRRATASPRARRSTSSPRRSCTSRTRRRTIRTAGARRPPLGPDERSARRQAVRRDLGDPQRPPLSSAAVKVLLVTLYFPPCRRRRRTASAEVRHASAGARDRDARARAGRLRSGSTATTSCAPPTLAWVHRARYLGPKGRKPAEELHGTTGLERASKQAAARRAPAARAGRERQLEPDRDPGRDPDRKARGHRRRRHDVAALVGPLRRRGRQTRHRHSVGRRPARLGRRASAPRRRADARAREGAGRACRRDAGHALRGRDRLRLRRDRGRDARAHAEAARS